MISDGASSGLIVVAVRSCLVTKLETKYRGPLCNSKCWLDINEAQRGVSNAIRRSDGRTDYGVCVYFIATPQCAVMTYIDFV